MRKVMAWASALVALAMACAGEETPQSTGSTGTGAAATSGPGPSSVVSGTAVGSTAMASTSSGPPPDCTPPADPGSIYEALDVEFATFANRSMCEWRGDVVLIVNIAAL